MLYPTELRSRLRSNELALAFILSDFVKQCCIFAARLIADAASVFGGELCWQI